MKNETPSSLLAWSEISCDQLLRYIRALKFGEFTYDNHHKLRELVLCLDIKLSAGSEPPEDWKLAWEKKQKT